MTNTKMTKKEAVQKWVNEFNAIPQNFIQKALGEELYDIELTPLTVGDVVYCEQECCGCEIQEIKENEEGNKVAILSPYSEEIEVDIDELHKEDFGDILPMWGTMWTFGSPFDEIWAKENLDKMAECGFRIYEDEDLGIFFGIDGAGYDFYESHWMPLYDAVGLKWHNAE